MLLVAGGRWDRIERRYLDEVPPRAKIIDLEESQVEFTRWFAQFLADLREGRPRDTSLALAAGDRRAGKTLNLLLATIALLLDVPAIDGSATIGWAVSASYQERDEIDKAIAEFIPPSWYIARKAPQYSYTFLCGSTLKNVSADDPETLRRGRADAVFLNEGQKLPLAALVNAIFGTADKGGVALVASNPPRRQIGEWVLQTACEHAMTWQSAGIGPMSVAVNLSPRQFKSAELVDAVEAALRAHRCPPSLLEVEITESTIMVNPELALETMNRLRSLGVGLSVDDFGTGYSSLGRLRNFPVSKLKIDRMFVRGIKSGTRDETIVDVIMVLAKKLGLKTVAEGVETREQAAFLESVGCDEYQGYLYSQPLPPEEFITFAKARNLK